MSGINLSALGLHDLMDREWLAVNHIGGYASQSILGLNTRKYHGLLVASMSPPVRRMSNRQLRNCGRQLVIRSASRSSLRRSPKFTSQAEPTRSKSIPRLRD